MRKLCILLTISFLLGVISNPSNAHENFADLAAKLSPAVVNISTSKTVKVNNGLRGGFFGQLPDGTNPFRGTPFEQFDQLFKGITPHIQNRKTTSLGSGFVVDKRGYVVTNNHVIDEAEEITITFNDDSKYEAELVGSDKKTDLAVLKIKNSNGKRFSYVSFGDSDEEKDGARVGDWVLIIGNPFGLGGTVTSGIISARARDINSGPFDDYIQTDAAINRGNSGGPMFNMDGEVIGINTAIFSPTGGSVGIGFAVPSSLAAPIIQQLKEGKEISRGWLGVKVQMIDDDIASSLGMKATRGALVAGLIDKSPAQIYGIKVGDVIVKFDGKKVTTMKKLPLLVAETKVGKVVDVVVLRNGKRKVIEVKIERLDEKNDGKIISHSSSGGDNSKYLHMSLAPIDGNLRRAYSIDDNVDGLFVLETNEVSAERGIVKGDIIVEANRVKTSKISQIRGVIKRAKKLRRKQVLLLIYRNGEHLFVAVPI